MSISNYGGRYSNLLYPILDSLLVRLSRGVYPTEKVSQVWRPDSFRAADASMRWHRLESEACTARKSWGLEVLGFERVGCTRI